MRKKTKKIIETSITLAFIIITAISVYYILTPPMKQKRQKSNNTRFTKRRSTRQWSHQRNSKNPTRKRIQRNNNIWKKRHSRHIPKPYIIHPNNKKPWRIPHTRRRSRKRKIHRHKPRHIYSTEI